MSGGLLLTMGGVYSKGVCGLTWDGFGFYCSDWFKC